VDVDNSIACFKELSHQHVDAERHIYPKGGHAFISDKKAGWSRQSKG